MNVEAFTIGGGEYVVNVFNAVAAWCGGGGYRSMLQVVMLMGFIYSLCVVAFSLDWRAWFNWFLQSTAIYGLLMVPTVTVKVTDRINPNLAPAMVANVPLGLGIMASFTSQVGDYLTRTAETVFVMPNQLAYSSNGFVYGSKLFQATRELQIEDPVFASNLDAHMKQCVFYDVMLGFKDLGDLAGKQDLWAGIGPGSQARAQPFITRNGDGTTSQSIQTCRDAYSNLTPQWQQVLTSASPHWAGRLFPGMSSADANNKLMADLPATYQAFTHNSDNAFAIMRQHLAINAFMQARDNFNGGTGAASIDSFAATRADLQTHNTYSAIAQGAMKWVPILNIVLTVVFYAMFPVLFPLFLMPRTGVATLKGYATGFFYLAAWGPLYVVLHMILMSKAITAASTIAPGGVTLATFSSIGAVNDETATLAGYLIAAVPFIAAGMARGATAIASQATSFLAPSQNAAEAAAAEATSGNYSYGNASLANATVNTQSRDQWNAAPTFSSGAAVSSFRDGHGTVTSFTSAGDAVINTGGAISHLAERPTLSSGTAAEARGLVSQFQTQSTQLSNRASSSFAAANTASRQLFSTMQEGHSSDSTTGRSNTDSFSNAADYQRQLSNRLVKDFGWKRDWADQASQSAISSASLNVGSAAHVGIRGEAGINAFGQAKAALFGDASISAGTIYEQRGQHSDQQSKSESADESVRRGIDFLRSESSSSRFQQAHDSFDRATATSSDSRVQGLTAQRNASLTEGRTLSAESAQLNDSGKRYERSLGLSESNGFQWSRDLSQDFVAFARREVASNPALAASGWEPGQVAGLTPQQEAVRSQVQGRFERSYIDQMKGELGAVGPLAARSLVGPGFSSRDQVQRWGGGQMEAVERSAPHVGVEADARDPGVSQRVSGSIGGVTGQVGQAETAAASEGGRATGRASGIRNYVDERNSKLDVTTIPLFDGALSGAKSLVGLGSVNARPLTHSLGVDVKPGTNISTLRPPMLPVISAVAGQAHSLNLPTPTITSGQDRHHNPGSLHPDGAALDWRANNITTGQGLLWAASTQKALGHDYDVIFEHSSRHPENNHLHTEYDPKGRRR